MNKLDTLDRIHVQLNQVVIKFSDQKLLSSGFKDRLLNAIGDVLRELENAEATSCSSFSPSYFSGNSSGSYFPESNITSSYQVSNSDSCSQQSSTSSSGSSFEGESVSVRNFGYRRDDSRCNYHQQAKNSDRSRTTPVLNDTHNFPESYNAESRADFLNGKLITTLPNMTNDQTHYREQGYAEDGTQEEESDEHDNAITQEDDEQTSISDETVNTFHSLRVSISESVADFNSKIERMQASLLESVGEWNITSKKFRGLPVNEKKEEMVKVLVSSDYGVCLNTTNITLPDSYANLVDRVFPNLSEGQRTDLLIYFAGPALRLNKYFQEIIKFIVQLHESCDEDDCIADQ